MTRTSLGPGLSRDTAARHFCRRAGRFRVQTATVALEIRFLNSLAIGDFGGDWRREFNLRNLDLLLDAGPQNESVASLENQIAIDARRAKPSPATEMMVSQMDHDFMVSVTLRLRYSLTSQKPPSFT